MGGRTTDEWLDQEDFTSWGEFERSVQRRQPSGPTEKQYIALDKWFRDHNITPPDEPSFAVGEEALERLAEIEREEQRQRTEEAARRAAEEAERQKLLAEQERKVREEMEAARKAAEAVRKARPNLGQRIKNFVSRFVRLFRRRAKER